MNTISDNKRIAKNTIFLYFRMLLIMVVTLYTSRVYLKVLGETDFGIYNIVGGIIVMMSFISSSMSISIQRFLNFEMGKNNQENVRRVFSSSLIIYAAFSLCILMVGETLGLWFLNTQMNIPSDRMYAANWVYHFTLIGLIANLFRIPYNAIITANERMNFYAYFSVLETFLKLGIVFILLAWGDVDKLVLLSILSAIVFIIITFCYKIYCNHHFISSRFQAIWDKDIMKKLLSFSGWSLLGSATNMGGNQGNNIILNIFCGVGVNAAVGVATQLISGINQLVSNFQMAFTPQLIKLYASDNREEFMQLVFRSSRFSYYLLLVISIPAMLCMEFILDIWLDEVPQYTVDFCRLILIYSLLDAISAPLWLSVQAAGKIRNYQILMSVLIALNLPLSYWALKEGMSPLSVWVIRVIINAITYFTRIVYLKGLIGFPAWQYIKDVICTVSVVTVLSIPIPYMLNGKFDGWLNLGIVTIVSVLITLAMVFLGGLRKDEKKYIYQMIKSKIGR